MFVLIPSLVVLSYFLVFASAQYSAEVRLVVRSADPGTANDKLDSVMALLGSSLSYSSSTQNAYVITHYVRSRALIDDLGPILNVRSIFQRPEADWWARLQDDASDEDLLAYWKDMVKAYVDAPSGIVTIEIRAFRPADALELTKAVVSLSEKLINDISERSRRDTMRLSEEDVNRSDLAVRSTLRELQELRNKEGMIDPLKAADETSKLLLQLMSEQIRLQSEEYIAARTLSSDAPTVRQIRTRLEVLNSQIQGLKASLAGNNQAAKTVAAALTKFETLQVQRQLNEKLLSLAEEGLARARIKAERQGLYLMVFVAPELPTKSRYPPRLASPLLFAIGAFLLWAIVALTLAAVEDHRT